MRACVESFVSAWEFLPQANPSQMVLPVEIIPGSRSGAAGRRPEGRVA